jgi:DNA-binding NarL/FixJ family response regulator
MSTVANCTRATRVLVVDDHPLMREAVRGALDAQEGIDVVGEARSAAETLSVARLTDPDVVVLDYRLPDSDGANVIKQLRDQGCEAAVVVLTSFGDQRNVRTAIDNGACAFLTKSTTDTARLVQAVRDAQHGDSTLSGDALTALLASVRGPSAQHAADITEREAQVWRLVAEGKTNAAIAADLFVAERTVKYHVSNLLEKTGSHTRGELVALAYRSGRMDVSG